MKLPQVFEQDISAKDVQLIPLLIIERDDWITWFDPYWAGGSSGGSGERSDKLLSTHPLYLSHDECIESSPNPYGDNGFPDGLYFEPLLLDNPVITEKIDVENRKYTISKCTFKISNTPYNGKRFSDILGKESLIGRRISFCYKSINSLAPISSVYFEQASFDNEFTDSFGDVYDEYPKVSPTFYIGEIREIAHDDNVVTITAEELGSSRFEQQIPKNKLPNNDSVMDTYRDSRIPMVYGYMPKSPVVVGGNKKVYADSRPINGFFRNYFNNTDSYGYPFNKGTGISPTDGSGDFGALFIVVDDHYCSIADTIDYKLGDNNNPNEPTSFFNFSDYPDNPTQIKYIDDDVYTTKIAQFATTPLSTRSVAQLMVVYKPSKITLERRDNAVEWDQESATISLGDGDTGFGGSTQVDSNNQPMGGDQLLEEEFEYMTDGNFESTHTLASADMGLANRSDAMIAQQGNIEQLEKNRFKHSLFRFVIETEPPIEFINRGGACSNAAQGTYAHWIAFGHWVMPEQSINQNDASKIIYIAARSNSNEFSLYNQIKFRWYQTEGGSIHSKSYTQAVSNTALTDTWGNTIKLGDVVRFSDYHDDETYAEDNPIQNNWTSYEVDGKSPLEIYDVNLINETGDTAWDKQYSNPYAKFDNDAANGKYHVHLGVFGFMSDLTLTSGNTNDFSEPPGDDNTSYNFDYQATLKGWLPEVTCMSVCDTKINYKDMYASVKGRVDVSDNEITNPVDIISDIFVNELGYPSSKIDQLSLNSALEYYQNWMFSFTQKDEINSKDLIEDIAKSTFMFPRIGFDGMLRFPMIGKNYSSGARNSAITIDSDDVIKYNYKLTKKQDLRTGTDIKFNYDHHSDKYFGDKDTKDDNGENIIDPTLVSEEHLDYYGLEDIESNIKEFESKYIRSEFPSNNFIQSSATSIRELEHILTHHYRNRHLIIKCQLPLKYLNIDVGENVMFSELLGGVRAYGINYAGGIDLVNDQYLLPLFICTNVKKTIEYVEIECMQLHDLRGFAEDITPLTGVWGSNLSEGDDYEPGDEEEGGLEDDPTSGDQVVPVSEFDLDSFTQVNFVFYDFGEANELPYMATFHPVPYQDIPSTTIFFEDTSTSGNAFIANGNNPLYFNDDNAGANSVFSLSNFKIVENGTAIPITSWEDLASLEDTVVTVDNINVKLLQVDFRLMGHVHTHTATLRQANQELGGNLDFQWELESIVGNNQLYHTDISGLPEPSVINTSTFNMLDNMIIFNHTNYSIRYVTDHTVVHGDSVQFTPEEEAPGVLLGDVNLDGTFNVLDIIQLVNVILGHSELENELAEYAADFTQDGSIDITDVVTGVNHILGNL